MRGVVRALALLLAVGGPAMAHVGNRVFRIPEVTDEDLASIDLHGGFAGDWVEVLGPPALTLADFKAWGWWNPPTGLDLRIWLAWHADPPRIYLAMERVDDVYTNTYHWNPNTANHLDMWRWDSGFEFMLDGDHGGGSYVLGYSEATDEKEYLRVANSVAQSYGAIAEVFDDSPQANRQLRTLAHGQMGINWYCDPPYADVGGGRFSESPTITVTELYVTPFDLLVYDDPGGSLTTPLRAGATIGFAIVTGDYEGTIQTRLSLPEDERAWSTADGFTDGLLAPASERGAAGPEQAAAASSWARIKVAIDAAPAAPSPTDLEWMLRRQR